MENCIQLDLEIMYYVLNTSQELPLKNKQNQAAFSLAHTSAVRRLQ